MYGPQHSDGRRRIRRALLSIGRKNGKTAIAAALVLVHLVGPEARMNAEVYSAATDRHQAGHIYKMARQMVELDDDLRELCKCIDSTKRIVVPYLGSFYASLSADARRQHGFNPSFVVYDELAQALDREMYDVLSTSFGAQPEGLMLVISTQSNDPLSIMSELADDAIKQEAGELVDPSFYGKVYATPDDMDPYDEAGWYLSNPALGAFRDRDDMRALAAKAKRSPAAEAAFRNLYLNQRVDGVASFVNRADWVACARDLAEFEWQDAPCYAGLDLSSRQDLTALALVFQLAPDRFVARMRFWAPAHGVEERERRDGAPYRVWADQGFLTLVPGKTVDYSVVARAIMQARGKYALQSLAYDRWRIQDLMRELEKEGWSDKDALKLVEIGQGFKDMSPAIDKLEAAIIEHQLYHGGHPVLTSCVANVTVLSDPAGNRKFDKRRKFKRIDGAVALAMAMSMTVRGQAEPKPGPSVYEQRGVLVF